MSVFPVNRVPDILKRMDMNSSQAEAMKTCFGILAIMSREDSNKLLIAKDGMEIILNAMTVHVDRTDVQESGCDLLWSLAFNSSSVKDIIAKHGGSVVLVRALKRHSRSADFLKSACGALSNMCQCKLNQEGVSTQGGLQPLVGSIHVHQTNAKLLPFIFDAIASIIVNNEENARTVSSLGIVPVVVASLSRHKAGTEVVKSGCHTLAILSDVKGQASKIAFAGGVPIILSLLDAHPLYSDLHRVAAVVLLRMLQESAHVGREITCHEGVRILLNSLEKGGAQQDTVAAVTHILYTVTNPNSPASSSIESQLWVQPPPNASNPRSMSISGQSIGDIEGSPNTAARKHSLHSLASDANSSGNNLTALIAAGLGSNSGGSNSNNNNNNSNNNNSNNNNFPGGTTALGGIVMILGQYSARRDVVRAACRLINNLSGYQHVVTALDRLHILDKIFECASIHRDTKDVIDSATSLVKTIHRRSMPVLHQGSPACIQGMLHVFRCKLSDEDAATAVLDTMTRLIETTYKLNIPPEKRKDLEESRMVDGKLWEYTALSTSLTLLRNVVEAEAAGETEGGKSGSVITSTPSGKVIWNKGTAKVVASMLSFIETVYHTHKLAVDPLLYKDTFDSLGALLHIMPYKSTDLTRRIERILPMIECLAKHPILEKSPGFASKKSLLSLKPPLPANGAPTGEEGTFVYNGVAVRRGGPGEDSVGASITGGAGSGGPSPLAMSRKVREISGTPADGGSDVSSEVNSEDGSDSHRRAAAAGTAGVAAVERDEINGTVRNTTGSGGGCSADVVTYSSSMKMLPQHPLKRKSVASTGLASKMSSGNNSSVSSSRAPSNNNLAGEGGNRLLDNWPNYLERLSLNSPSLGVNKAFFIPSGQDASTPGRMSIAYESTSAAGRGLMSKCPTPVPYIVPLAGLGEPFEHSLTFDSDFESGNLVRAIQKGDSNYDLFLRSDLHTPGHTQWFYFAVSNTHPPDQVKLAEQGLDVAPVKVKFNIVNFTKPDSLFNLGMRPVVYSVQDANTKNIGWVRSGTDISYFGNSFMRNNTAGEGVAYYYTLTFTLEFHNPKDTVLIAYSYPYTMSDYHSHIGEILDRPGSQDIIRQFRLCQTLSGEDCDLLVITNFADKEKDKIGPINLQMVDIGGSDTAAYGGSSGKTMNLRSSKRQQQQQAALKPALFLSARVHPGETPASWMMKGMLEFLTSDCSQAFLLRQVFVIFIVPMLNPDGVIFGNNRCSLAGVDLNRQWKLPIKSLHPTIYHFKYFMLAQRKLRDVTMYIDLHGHSRKYNVFMYGCDDKKRPRPQVRAFPRFFSLHNVGKKYVCYADCSFTVKKGRESTARVVVAKELNIPCSFTLEATFCGSNYGPLKHCHMNIGHMQEVGSALCDAILNYSISEGQVKDTILVPSNMRAVAQVERAIAAEGLGAGAGDNSGSEKGDNHTTTNHPSSGRERSASGDKNSSNAAEGSSVSIKRTSNGTLQANNRRIVTSQRAEESIAGGSASGGGGGNGLPAISDRGAGAESPSDYDINLENTHGGSGGGKCLQDAASEDVEDDENNNNMTGLGDDAPGDHEEVDSQSDDSGDDASDAESMCVASSSNGKVHTAPSTVEEGRSRITSMSLPVAGTGGSSNGMGSLAVTLPNGKGMGQAGFSVSGRQTIMSGAGASTADKISGMRALTTPALSGLRTLSPSGPGGALGGGLGGAQGGRPSASAMLKAEIDANFGFGGDVSDGIASLQLSAGSGNIASATIGGGEAFFSKAKKEKGKKKKSFVGANSSGKDKGKAAGAGAGSSKKKLIKDVFSGSGKGYGDDLDLLESATVGAGGVSSGVSLESLGGKYSSSASAGAGMSRYAASGSASSGGGSSGLMLPSSKSFEVRKSGGAGGGTIVKAEFQDMFFRNDAPDGEANNINLAKTQPVATTFGLPKLNGSQK